MIAIIGIRCINYAHYTSCKSCLPFYGISIIRLLSFLFLDEFEGNGSISVAIKSGSTVSESYGTATVESYDTATVESYGTATVESYGTATVESYGRAKEAVISLR